MRDLERRYLDLSERYSELRTTFGPDWPEIKRVKGAMDEIKRDLDIVATEQAAKVVRTAKGDFQEAQDRESLLRQSLNAQKTQRTTRTPPRITATSKRSSPIRGRS